MNNITQSPWLARILGVMGVLWGTFGVEAQGTDEFERPPIEYSATPANDAISSLNTRLASGSISFPSGSDRDVIRWLLKELKVPEASQILVFSQTSFQNDRIRPEHPRAIYFNDEVYVGWVPGGLMELTPMDPRLGPIFYTFDPRAAVAAAAQGHSAGHFRRDADCLRCHGTFVRDVPAVFARSLMVDSEGRPTGTLGGRLVDFTTPFTDRWGGWYVTGRHGSGRHRGNVIPADGMEVSASERERGANVTNLAPMANLSGYLMPTSDIVALMVFEHQLAVQNALTRGAHHARRMLHYQEGVQRGLGEAVTSEPVYESTRRAIASSAQEVLDALLSVDEATLPPGGIEGSQSYREAYESTGPRTQEGRSLRQLDLQTRLYRYRCSPLIYSPQFAALPVPLKNEVMRRLKAVLGSIDGDSRYTYLRPAERRMIREILRATLPAYAAVDS